MLRAGIEQGTLTCGRKTHHPQTDTAINKHYNDNHAGNHHGNMTTKYQTKQNRGGGWGYPYVVRNYPGPFRWLWWGTKEDEVEEEGGEEEEIKRVSRSTDKMRTTPRGAAGWSPVQPSSRTDALTCPVGGKSSVPLPGAYEDAPILRRQGACSDSNHINHAYHHRRPTSLSSRSLRMFSRVLMRRRFWLSCCFWMRLMRFARSGIFFPKCSITSTDSFR